MNREPKRATKRKTFMRDEVPPILIIANFFTRGKLKRALASEGKVEHIRISLTKNVFNFCANKSRVHGIEESPDGSLFSSAAETAGACPRDG